MWYALDTYWTKGRQIHTAEVIPLYEGTYIDQFGFNHPKGHGVVCNTPAGQMISTGKCGCGRYYLTEEKLD